MEKHLEFFLKRIHAIIADLGPQGQEHSRSEFKPWHSSCPQSSLRLRSFIPQTEINTYVGLTELMSVKHLSQCLVHTIVSIQQMQWCWWQFAGSDYSWVRDDRFAIWKKSKCQALEELVTSSVHAFLPTPRHLFPWAPLHLRGNA